MKNLLLLFIFLNLLGCGEEGFEPGVVVHEDLQNAFAKAFQETQTCSDLQGEIRNVNFKIGNNFYDFDFPKSSFEPPSTINLAFNASVVDVRLGIMRYLLHNNNKDESDLLHYLDCIWTGKPLEADDSIKDLPGIFITQEAKEELRIYFYETKKCVNLQEGEFEDLRIELMAKIECSETKRDNDKVCNGKATSPNRIRLKYGVPIETFGHEALHILFYWNVVEDINHTHHAFKNCLNPYSSGSS